MFDTRQPVVKEALRSPKAGQHRIQQPRGHEGIPVIQNRPTSSYNTTGHKRLTIRDLEAKSVNSSAVAGKK